MSDRNGSRSFGGVRIEWRCEARTPACDVKVFWQDRMIVAASLGPAAPQLPFSARTEDDKRQIAGLLELRSATGGPRELVLRYLRYPGGNVDDVVLWPSLPPPPPPRPADDPPPEEIGVAVEEDGEHDLFPYVYLRPWPRVSPAQLENRFVAYLGGCDDGADSLYCRLLAVRDDRAAMEAQALAFIEGEEPYQGQFLGQIRNLDGPIRELAGAEAELRELRSVSLERLQEVLVQRLGMSWEQIAAYVAFDPGFEAQLDRAWQNLFALAVILGYDPRLLDDVIRTVVLARLLQRIVEPDVPAPWPPEKLREGVWATVALPGGIFPLPRAKPPEPPPGKEGPRRRLPPPEPIQPYAIGDLQLVRQRLLRYELGEVSAIENVLTGESKETTRRSLRRTEELSAERSDTGRQTGTVLLGTRADLLDETRRTLALDFKLEDQTSYGPPAEGTAKGYVQVRPNPTGGGEADQPNPQAELVERAAQFARNVTARTVDRLARRVSRHQVTAVLDENETTVITRFDAGRAGGPVRGVYRWVNKVYQAHVVNYGHRLILELLIPDPARAYVSGEESLEGVSLSAPVPPADLGVPTFREVSRDPDAPGYYAALAARYDARGVTPPPPERETVGIGVQGGVEVHLRQLEVPEGYRAERAFVTCNWAEGVAPSEAYGVVGRAPFRLASSAPDHTVAVSLNSEAAAVPLAVAWRGQPAPKPSPDPPPGGEGLGACLATVEVEAALSEARYERWQIETYDLLVQAFRRQRQAYLDAAGVGATGPATRNPLGSREAVRGQLRKDSARQLLELALRRTGEAEELESGEPRYAQFLDRAFEWREMAFSFSVVTGDSPASRVVQRYAGEDQLFTAFLEARFARVLLPVTPGHAFAVAYFLAAGAIWDGPDALTPANQESVGLINELKSASVRGGTDAPRSAPWEIRVPTSMVMLQDGPELPGLARRRQG